jgi:hypothetical protein
LVAQQIVGGNTAKPATSAPDHASLAANYGKLPLSFEKNQGQVDSQVRFLSRGNGYSLFLTDSAAVLSLRKPEVSPSLGTAAKPRIPSSLAPKQPASFKTDVVRMELAGASRGLHVTGDSQLPGTANYFIGNDPAKWHSAVPMYSQVKYDHVYPGVDLVYYGNQSQLEYDFIVAPNADPRPIKLHFAGASKLKIAANGDLEVVGKNGQIAFHKPVVYQELGGRRKDIEGSFNVLARNTVAFVLGSYDHSHEVVIDPTLVYSTYLGGSGNGSLQSDTSQASAVAVDTAGNVYITGTTSSADFPVSSGALERVPNQGKINYVTTYSFIAKLDPTGSTLLYSTYLGGSGQVVPTTSPVPNYGDYIYSIAVDSSGDAFVTGLAASPDFPVTSGAYQTTHNAASVGDANGFITKLNPTGSALVYSTYLGGSGGGDICNHIAIDASGDAYVVGDNAATDFPVTSGVLQSSPRGMFITKMNPSGTGLVYSTYFGSAFFSNEYANAIAVDGLGNAYIAGQTASSSFPVTTNAYQKVNKAFANNGVPTGFIAKIDTTGSTAPYVTLLGGSGSSLRNGGDEVFGIAVDAAGEAYVTGITGSPDFPTSSNAIQTTNKTLPLRFTDPAVSYTNAFVAKLNAAGSGLLFSTYLGSTNGELMLGSGNIALDSTNRVYVTGTTYGTDFPVTASAIQGANNSAGHSGNINAPTTAVANAFVTTLGSDGSLIYSSYFGGSGLPVSVYEYGAQYPEGSYLGEDGVGLALDSANAVYLAGNAQSEDLAVTSGAYQTTKTALETAYVAKFDLSAAVSGATITTVLSDANPQNTAVKITLTARVQSVSGTGVPTGQASFSVDGATGVDVTLDNKGQATFATNSLSSGTHTVAVNYLGDSTYTKSSATLIQSVDAGPATISSFSGDGQSTPYLSAFPMPLVVLVKDASGNPVPGALVEFKGTGLTFLSNPVLTGYDGKASTGVIASAKGALTAVATAVASSVALTSPTYFTLNSTSAIPTFSPAAGTYTSAQSVTISDTTPGAVIYCTTDGTTPTTNSTICSGPISVTTSETIEAIAIATGYSNTPVVSASYVISLPQAAIPTFSPTAGTYTSAQTVTIADSTPGAVIYYTTNGTPPTTSSAQYTSAIAVNSTETIEAIAVAPGYSNSAVVSALYTISIPPPAATTPTFTPAAGTYTSVQGVTISDTTPGATIYYTTDGSTPTSSSTKYMGALTVGTSETISAIAVVSGYTNSAVATAQYFINLPPADFSIGLSSAALTLAAGQSATVTLTATPANGFSQAITFSCSGLPSNDSCSFSPSTITPSSAPATTTLTVAESTTVASHTPSAPWPGATGVTLTMTFCWLGWKRRRRISSVLFVLVLMMGVGAFVGCGGGTPSTTGPSKTTYNVTVTATSGSLSHTAPLNITQ